MVRLGNLLDQEQTYDSGQHLTHLVIVNISKSLTDIFALLVLDPMSAFASFVSLFCFRSFDVEPYHIIAYRSKHLLFRHLTFQTENI